MSQLYLTLVSELTSVFLISGTNNATNDINNHANKFSEAIDNYSKELLDPANRKPQSTDKSLISDQIKLIQAGSADFTSSANAAALLYATGIYTYISNIILSKESLNDLPAPLIPPGKLDNSKTTVVNLNVLTTIQSDFKDIFNSDIPLSNFETIESFIAYKSTLIANLYRKYVTNVSNINVKLEGKDSNPLVSGGVDFILTGPFKEE